MRIGEFYSKGIFYHKSDIPQTLRPFVNYRFSSGGYIGDDFKSFNTKFKNVIKKLLPEGFEIHDWNRGHYYCSGVIKTPNNITLHFSICSVLEESSSLIIFIVLFNISAQLSSLLFLIKIST